MRPVVHGLEDRYKDSIGFVYLDIDDRATNPLKEQLAYGTGGPQSPDMLMSLDDLKRELAGLEFIHAVHMEREVREGSGHTGLASVIQLLAKKP